MSAALGRPLVMGVLNATPDSFSGDGLALDADALVERGRAQLAAGAAILDVGGESTRPGSTPVAEDVELARVLPVVERLARDGALVSIDTSKPAVAEAALRAGARVVNDVSGLRDERLAEVAARHRAWLVVTDNGWTHPRGDGDPVELVCAELRRLVGVALRAGVARERVVVDPGLGFGKSAEASLALLAATATIRSGLRPHLLLAGPSRKSFIGRALGIDDPSDRLEGTLAAVSIAAFLGADMVRVHDVRAASRAAALAAGAAAARPGARRLAYVGLGANLGDRRASLRRAVAALAKLGRVVALSGLWETAPREVTDQPPFLNAVAAVELPLRGPGETMAWLKLVEELAGRRPGERYGPRVIDLDLLAFAGARAREREGEVVVPHPRLRERRFALAPLAEVAPDLEVPGAGHINELLAVAADQSAVRVEGRRWATGTGVR